MSQQDDLQRCQTGGGIGNYYSCCLPRAKKKGIIADEGEFKMDVAAEGHGLMPGGWVSKILERNKAHAS